MTESLQELSDLEKAFKAVSFTRARFDRAAEDFRVATVHMKNALIANEGEVLPLMGAACKEIVLTVGVEAEVNRAAASNSFGPDYYKVHGVEGESVLLGQPNSETGSGGLVATIGSLSLATEEQIQQQRLAEDS